MKTRDRFVNNALLECISRPQYDWSCSVTALTAVINYLYAARLGLTTQEVVAKTVGEYAPAVGSRARGGGPNNLKLIGWFDRYVRANSVPGRASIVCDGTTVADWAQNEGIVRRLKGIIGSRAQALVYHCVNHYCLVCGYFESAEKPAQAFADNPLLERWLIIGDHYVGDDDPGNPPLWATRWGDVRKVLQIERPPDDRYCLLLFERTAR